MSTAIRIRNLSLSGTGADSLPAMERHGKREDGTSRARRVREADPLVWGGLNLRELYDAHVAGVSINKANRRPIMHALVQFPTEVKPTAENKAAQLKLAVKFFQEKFGGDAVFAARLDQDEAGEHSVDVFLCPKYVKKTGKTWASTSKHLKEMCLRHSAEIERRMGKPMNNRRAQGMALQSEWRDWLQLRLKRPLTPKNEKSTPSPDRVEPEAYKALQEAHRLFEKAREMMAKAKRAEEDADAYREANMRLNLRNEQLERWAQSIGIPTPRPYDEPESP
jgi:hypothetical protein